MSGHVFQDQTILHAEGQVGNCFQAALASVLGKKIENVPHFALLGMMHWLSCCVAWLDMEGYETDTAPDDSGGLKPLQLCVIRGISPRGVGHAVVGDTATGEMVHDPHPSRAGLAEVNSRLYIFPKAILLGA